MRFSLHTIKGLLFSLAIFSTLALGTIAVPGIYGGGCGPRCS